MNENTNIAAIYCRLSKEDLDRDRESELNESESIQNQKLLLTDYALQNGFLIHRVYVDEDYSGFSDRPQFRQMIKDAESGLFNTILCKSQSRFSREMESIEHFLHGRFMEWGIRFIGLTDNVDTSVKGNKKARQIYGLINEWYSEDLSENIRAVFRKKMQAGQYLGPFACYGYEKDAKDRHKIVVDEEAAQVVKEIFALYLEGYGANRIALALTQRGIPTPTQYKKNKGLKFINPRSGQFSERYGAWSTNTVRRILRNEAYIGTLIQGRERRVSYKSRKVVIAPKDEWIVIKNSHEPIIDEKTFNTVQNLVDRKRTDYGYDGNRRQEKSSPHLLAGKIICADCGTGMQRSGKSRDGATHYIRCKLAAKTKNRDCTPHCIGQERIEGIVAAEIRYILSRLIDDSCRNEIVDEVLNQIGSMKHSQTDRQERLAELDSKIRAAEKNKASAYVDKLKGVISEADYLSFRNTFEGEKQACILQKERLEGEPADSAPRPNPRANIHRLLEKYSRLDVLTHEVVNAFVDSILIGEKYPSANEQEIKINWLF